MRAVICVSLILGRMDQALSYQVHQYKNNGYNIVLDVNSGAVHIVDDVVYDVLALYLQMEGQDGLQEELAARLKDKYPSEEVKEAFAELMELKEAGDLFTEDAYTDTVFDFKNRQTVVKALCLHIAHDCNLACRYCFAEEGEYHGRRALMSYEVGKAALDFLIANSGDRRTWKWIFRRRADDESGCGQAAGTLRQGAGKAA